MNVVKGLLGAAALVMSASVMAAPQSPPLKAGLWEMQMQGGSVGGAGMPDMAEVSKAMKQMKAQLANLPPEQRKMIEAQMGNAGVSMSESGGIRVCLTEEDIKREAIPISDGKCSATVKSRTATRWVVSNVCTEPAMTGEAEIVFEGSTAYRVHVKGAVTEKGKQQPFDMKMRMQHVSSDCGKVKSASALQAEHQKQMQQLQKPRKPVR